MPGTFSYSPAAGTVPAIGTTQLTATFTPADTTDYSSATASVPLTVNATAITAILSWATPSSISYGTPLSGTQLNATANVPGNFTYSPSAGTVLSAGVQAISVTFKPTGSNAAAVTVTRQLTVAKATPQITWNTPGTITAGASLSGSQLSATANVPGSFIYLPAAGTTFSAGKYTLGATFVPSDATDYASTTATVSLTVNAAAAAPTGPVAIVSPVAGGTIAGQIQVLGQIQVPLDSAGSFLILDGAEVGTRRITGPPYIYPLDTTALSNGQHTLALYAHDIGNNNYYSAPVVINVANSTGGGQQR